MEKHQRHGNSMNEGSEALESIVCLGSWVVHIFLSFTPAFSPLCLEESSPPIRSQLHGWVFLL